MRLVSVPVVLVWTRPRRVGRQWRSDLYAFSPPAIHSHLGTATADSRARLRLAQAYARVLTSWRFWRTRADRSVPVENRPEPVS